MYNCYCTVKAQYKAVMITLDSFAPFPSQPFLCSSSSGTTPAWFPSLSTVLNVAGLQYMIFKKNT